MYRCRIQRTGEYAISHMFLYIPIKRKYNILIRSKLLQEIIFYFALHVPFSAFLQLLQGFRSTKPFSGGMPPYRFGIEYHRNATNG